MDHKNDLGTPKWKQASLYPDVEVTTDNQWQWEFLRRRPDYRKAWLSNFDACQKNYDEIIAILDDRERYRSVGSTDRALCETFGVERIMAPWCSDPGPHFWRHSFGWSLGTPSPKTDMHDMVAQHEKFENDGILLIAFDTNKPFEGQLEKAKQYFQAVQLEKSGSIKKPPRHHKSKWIDYLRAIDARDQGATYADLYTDIVLSELHQAEYDAQLDRNLPALGMQIWQQAQNIMFKGVA